MYIYVYIYIYIPTNYHTKLYVSDYARSSYGRPITKEKIADYNKSIIPTNSFI